MIRISAFVWILVLGLLGVGLFQVKYNVQSKEVELRRINKQVEANHAAIHVLEAEWSYLNDPTRLADLTRRHTDLVPTQANQIKRFSDLPPRPATAQPDLPALSSAAPSTTPSTSASASAPAGTGATQPTARVIPVSATPGSIPTAMPAVASTIAATPAANANTAKATPTPASTKTTATQASKTATQATKPASTQAAKPGADEVIDAILADMQRQQTTPPAPAAGDQ